MNIFVLLSSYSEGAAIAAVTSAIIIAVLVALAISVIPTIFFLLTIQNTLKEVSFENQKMQPAQVWLTFIPVFGVIWQFIIVNRVADSLQAEFTQRNITVSELRPGYSIGLAYCILFCCCIIPFLNILASLGGLICWIIYWVKIADYKTKLMQHKSLQKIIN